jgi:hypothetical protein
MLTSDRIIPRPAGNATAGSPAGSRIEELSERIKALYQKAEKLSALERTARRLGVRFANNAEAVGLEKRVIEAVTDIYNEAGRLEEFMALEDLATPRDALLLMLTVNWRLDNGDDGSLYVIENAWKGITAYLERSAGVPAEELGFDALDARRSSYEIITEKVASYERSALLGESGLQAQTKEDMRNRLAAIFRVIKEENDENDERQGAMEEALLALEGDEAAISLARLIIAKMGEIFTGLNSGFRDVRVEAQAALGALRYFDLEKAYRLCVEHVGEEEAA